MWRRAHSHYSKQYLYLNNKIGEGFVYTMGNNLNGRLGLGDQSLTHSSVPCLVESLLNERISKIACGVNNTIAITETGIVYTWGLGDFGVLGTGNSSTQYSPTMLEYFRNNNIQIESASCGNKHAGFVSSNNTKKL